MGPAVQIAVGIVGSLAIFAIGAALAGRIEGAIYAVAALGWSALGVILLADLLIVLGLTQGPANLSSTVGLQLVAFQVGGVSLGLFALVLILMGGFMGIVWAGRHRRFAGHAIPGGALVALLAGVALTFASYLGQGPLAAGMQRVVLPLAGFGLGTLAAALIAFWAVVIVRSRPQSRRMTASAPPA